MLTGKRLRFASSIFAIKRYVPRTLLATGSLLTGLLWFSQPAYAGKDFDAIKARGHLICGVSTASGGFSAPDSNGKWTGIDVDLCKAVSIAIFGSADNTAYVPLTDQARFTALQTGEVDLLTHNATETLERDAGLGLSWEGINYYDAIGVMVPAKLHAKQLADLNGATICMTQGGTNEAAVRDFFDGHKIRYKQVVFESLPALNSAFFAGRCDIYAMDQSALAAARALATKTPADYVILPDVLAKSPLGPVVRQGDPRFAKIVRWTLSALIDAEELDVTSQNATTLRKTGSVEQRRLLGAIPGPGKALGLTDDWAYRVIEQIGSYGESYARNVGEQSPLKLPRGANALWTRGGLMYSPPI